ncbi:hypothetical protein K3L72_14695 [Bacillus altitudinis]|nr:hypothetical protein [Bacillus altitudinis]MCW4359024.1 hypothetical protein [Bacillus altitudinis]USK25577.1 hypothetical protein LIS79_06285 [Bacillus altitudinis]WHX70706.1 hypothetical protein QNH40_14510 [Bacillus altitudinis]
MKELIPNVIRGDAPTKSLEERLKEAEKTLQEIKEEIKLQEDMTNE